MNAPFRRRWLCLGLLPFLLSGCQSARMAIPAELESRSDVYPCIGRGGFTLSETFSFGPYQVVDVRRGWTRRVAWRILPYERTSARQQYEFTLLTPSGETWQGRAAVGVRRENLKDTLAGGELTWGLERDVSVAVRFGLAGATHAWTLLLAEQTQDAVLNGILTNGQVSYRIDGTRNLAGTSIPLMENSGYFILDGARRIAAVDVVNAGSVLFARDLPPAQRPPLAAAAAALLLYRDISGD